MRTTLTIDDDLFVRLKNLAHQQGIPLKRAVNETIRGGLDRPHASESFSQETFSLGRPRVDLTKAGQIAADIENQEIAEKAELGR